MKYFNLKLKQFIYTYIFKPVQSLKSKTKEEALLRTAVSKTFYTHSANKVSLIHWAVPFKLRNFKKCSLFNQNPLVNYI